MKNYQKRIDILEQQKENIFDEASEHLVQCYDKCHIIGKRRNNINKRIINFAMSIIGKFKDWVDRDSAKLAVETEAVESFLRNNR